MGRYDHIWAYGHMSKRKGTPTRRAGEVGGLREVDHEEDKPKIATPDDGKRCGVYGARRTVSVTVAFHERSEYGGVPRPDVTGGRRILKVGPFSG